MFVVTRPNPENGVMSIEPPTTSYEGASAHYLSPHRRDPVKRFWEEPFTCAVLGRAIARLDVDGASCLRVLDVGSGTGDGIALLDRTLAASPRCTRFEYVGLDSDPEMVGVAADLHRDRHEVAFVHGDVREGPPMDDVDLYLSAGVPYSHLDPGELRHALALVFAAAARRRRRTAVIIDVLGRFSIEWTSCWSSDRWDYRMSFFHGAEDISGPMMFHDRRSMRAAVLDAASAGGARLAGVTFYDRSIMVGRHTTTRAYNPALPPYRPLVNALYGSEPEMICLADLRIIAPDEEAPPEVSRFFRRFSSSWNDRLAQAYRIEKSIGATRRRRRRLAENLRDLEHTIQEGLGTGHSLTAVAIVDPNS